MRFSILVALAATLATPALADGDSAAGKLVFNKCRACHAVGDNAKNRVGPVLNNVFGRVAGAAEGYKYSSAMIAAGENGLVWTEETLKGYLPAPRDYVKGTKMSFAGIHDPTDLDNLIAYLREFSPDYTPETSNEPMS